MTKRKKIILVGAAILFCFSIFENILLVMQNKQLKNTLTELNNSPKSSLAVGDSLKEANLTDMNGKLKKLSYKNPSSNYLIYIFNTSCPHCEKNISFWKEFCKINKKYKIIGISLDDLKKTKEWVKKHTINFQTFIASDTSFSRIYKVSAIPVTVFIGWQGLVRKIWIGELDNKATMEIKNFITGRDNLIKIKKEKLS